MNESNEEEPTRLEIRQALANPLTTEEEKLYLKLVLLRRIASMPAKTRSFIAEMLPALAAEMSARHPSGFSQASADKAENEIAKIEALLTCSKGQALGTAEHDAQAST